MTNQGLKTEREKIIRYVAVEWYRWRLGSNPIEWNLRDVKNALILWTDELIEYAKCHGNYEFSLHELLDFYKNWNVG